MRYSKIFTDTKFHTLVYCAIMLIFCKMCNSKKTHIHSKQINSIRLGTTFVAAFTENII